MGMRAIISGKSMRGKGVVVQSMIWKQFHNVWSHTYVCVSTVFQDRSTWGPVEDYLTNDLRIDLKKEPALFDTFDPAVVQKIIDDNSKVVKWQKEKGHSKQIAGILWIFDDITDSPEIIHARGDQYH